MRAGRPKIILVVGAKDSGKTTYLEHLVKKAELMGLTVTGFLSRGDLNKDNYYLENLNTNEKLVLASKKSGLSSTIKRGDYYFSPDTLHYGNQLLKKGLGADLIVLDEFGPLEYDGQGFRESFDFILKGYSGIFCIAMRPGIFRKLKEGPGKESFFHLFTKKN